MKAEFLNIGHASYQTGDMWHVALAAVLYPNLRPIVLWSQADEYAKDDCKRWHQKAMEYSAFYQTLIDSKRVITARVENVRVANRTLRRRDKRCRFIPHDVPTADGPVQDVYYITFATHLIRRWFSPPGNTLPNAVHAYRTTCLSQAWLKSHAGVIEQLDKHIDSLPGPSVLIWIRRSDVNAHLSMTPDWFECLTTLLDELGYRWTCAGEPLVDCDATHESYPLIEFYRTLKDLGCNLTTNDMLVEDKRYQVYLFDGLRQRGWVSIGFRSGTLDGCSAFLGMPTICLDSSPLEGGAIRQRKLKRFYQDIFYTDRTRKDLQLGRSVAPNAQALRPRLAEFLQAHGQRCKL